MSDTRCPSEAELVAFADADLSPERLSRIEHHLKLCGPCARTVAAYRQLIEDVAAPSSRTELNVPEHVAEVMKRLDAPVAQTPRPRWALWSGGLAVAAAAALGFMLGRQPDATLDSYTARGGATEASLTRDVGVQLYAQEEPLRALDSGARIQTTTALTAGLRNLGREPAYLLLFAVDMRHAVHWIAPEFTTEGSDPTAVLASPDSNERLLPKAVVFDDLAEGPLRVVAVLSREPTRVSEVEALSSAELSAEGLMKRYPLAEVRQFRLDVSPAP